MTPARPTMMDPTRAVFSTRSAIPRSIGVLAGIAATLLPVLTATGFGTSQSVALPQASALPILAGLALLSPAIGPMRSFGRLLDLMALLAGLATLFYVANLYFDAIRQVTAMPGMNTMGAVSIMPGFGPWAIITATAAMGTALILGRRH